MEALLCHLMCTGSPFLEHGPGVYGLPTWVFSSLLLYQVCSHPPESGWLHGVSRAIIQGPTLRFGCGYSLEDLTVIFEFVFCKQSLMTLAAEHTHAHTPTYTIQPVSTAGNVLEGQPGPDLSLVLVTVVAATRSAVMAKAGRSPREGRSLRGSGESSETTTPSASSLPHIQSEPWDGSFHCSGNNYDSKLYINKNVHMDIAINLSGSY